MIVARSDWCEVIPHCSFDVHISNNELSWVFFSCVYWPSVCLLWKNVCLGFRPIFWLGYLFFWQWTAWTACVFWRLIFCQLSHLQYYFPFRRLSFHFVYSFLCCTKVFKLNSIPFKKIFVFISITLGGGSKRILLWFMSKCSAYVFWVL